MATSSAAVQGAEIRDAAEADLPWIVDIYNDAVRHSTATWNDQDVTLEDRREWLRQRRELQLPILVAVAPGGAVLGYSSLSPFRAWSGYRHTAEHGIYLAAAARGQGLGKRLLAATLERARQCRLHCVVACMCSSSEHSIRLHTSGGFTNVGYMPQVGRKFDRWLDLVIMQRLLD